MPSCSRVKNLFGDLSSKTYLITGASSGIGRHLALLLDSYGARVILNGRDESTLKETLACMSGKEHIISVADLRDLNHVAWLKQLQQESPTPIAGIGHCAGVHQYAPLRGYTEDALLASVQNFTVPTMNLFMAAARTKKSPTLNLASMSSISTQRGIVGNALYGASRIAMEALCRNIAIEFSSKGIRCNTVAAGHMLGSRMVEDYTQQIGQGLLDTIGKEYPLGVGHVSDAANMMLFLLSDASRWITGQVFTVDGGFSIKGF